MRYPVSPQTYSDGEDLRVAVERQFQIELSEQDCCRIETVGDMHATVVSKLGSRHARCWSSALFYQLRRALVEQFGLPIGSIRPNSNVDTLIPSEQRRSQWRKLAITMRLRLPELRRPPSIVLALSALAVSIPIIGLYAGQFLLSVLCIPVICLLARTATIPLARRLPSDCANVRDLVYLLGYLNPQAFSIRENISEKEAQNLLRVLIADQLGAKTDQILDDMQLAKDLNVDW